MADQGQAPAGGVKEEFLEQHLWPPFTQMQGLRHNNRVMALLKAMAMEACGGGVLKLQRYLDEAKPRTRGEFDYLKQNWPELENFFTEHAELRSTRTILERF